MTSTAKIASVLGVSPGSGASAADIANAMATVPSPDPTAGGGDPVAQIIVGVVQSLQLTATPPTVTCTLRGSTTQVTGLRFGSWYAPQVGDRVRVVVIAGSHWVLGTLAQTAPGNGGLVPIGAILMFPISYTSTAWLLCNGGTFSSTTYPGLYAALGSTTLPNLQGLTPMGAGANGVTLGAASPGGQMPSHTHTDTGHSHSHAHASPDGTSFWTTHGGPYVIANGNAFQADGSVGADVTTDATLSNANISSTGSGTANMPPYLGVAYYIRAL